MGVRGERGIRGKKGLTTAKNSHWAMYWEAVVEKFAASAALPITLAISPMAEMATMPFMARLVWLASWPAKSSR